MSEPWVPSEDELDALQENLTEALSEPTEEEQQEMEDATGVRYICLIGAHGSGKSALAAAIAEEYGIDNIVDGYVDALEEETGLSFGFNASYIPNMFIVTRREIEDHNARRDGASVIVCGSLVESLAYAGLQAEYHQQQISTPMQQAILGREVAAAQVIGLMIQDVMRFTNYFYIKLPPEIEVPGQDPKYERGQRVLDNAISTCLQQLGVPVTQINAGPDVEHQMQTVKETLGEA